MGDGGFAARVYAAARAAIAPRERIGGAEWADRERWIGLDEGAPLPGQWTSLPWQREILDALADPVVEWMAIKKATQVGVSELIRNAVGRWAIHDPGDVLWVMTTQAAAQRAMVKLRKMFQNTPVLRPLLSDRRTDTTLLELVLVNGMRVVIGWAGSAASLSSDPFRRVVLDEAAYYKWLVQGGSPTHLADDRTKTAGRRRQVVVLSSPREDDDAICVSHRETADRRVFMVPCPDCGLVQPWEWERVRWPGGSVLEAPTEPEARLELAEVLGREKSAWMSCEQGGCDAKLQPMVLMRAPGARWGQEEPAPASERRAYHVPEAWHWETTLSSLVVKFLRATTPAALGTFWTGSLGLVRQTSSAPIEPSLIRSRAVHPAGVVPSWATIVLATADTQLAGWWLMVRAWGPGGRSRLLDWGWVETEEELVARGLRASFPVEGSESVATPAALAIDSGGGMKTEDVDGPDGSRTRQVYALVRRHRPRTMALKGEGDKHALDGAHTRESKAVEGIELHLVNKGFFADALAALLRASPVLWEECVGADDPQYVRQMSSEHRVQETSAKGSRWMWRKKSAGTPNHLWDCARYQVWLAEHMGVETRKGAAWAPKPRLQDVVRRGPAQEDEWRIGR